MNQSHKTHFAWLKNCRAIPYAAFTIAICSLTVKANADGFDTFGDQQRLEGQVVIASGNISRRTGSSVNTNDIFNADRYRSITYDMGRYCFKGADSDEDLSGKAGLLMLDQFSNAAIGILSPSTSSIKVKLMTVILFDCMTLAIRENNKKLDQLEQQLEILKQQRALLDQMLKNQKPATKKSPL